MRPAKKAGPSVERNDSDSDIELVGSRPRSQNEPDPFNFDFDGVEEERPMPHNYKTDGYDYVDTPGPHRDSEYI